MSETKPRIKPMAGYAAEVIDSSPYVKTETFAGAAREIRDAVKMDDAPLVRELLVENYHILMAGLDTAVRYRNAEAAAKARRLRRGRKDT